eukprot:GABV01000011.1.p1 GENE.GABV01000011.1~~GABV01000011.1.p1  ORF type:complete len:404 (+),score=180.10 GABV01000011.1:940-2151(+)
MPLNKIETREHDYPVGPNAIPMIHKLEFDPQIKPAMDQIFGKTLVCRNMEACAAKAREGWDTITLEGDRVDRNNIVEGGYHTKKEAKLEIQIEVNAHLETRESLDAELDELKQHELEWRGKVDHAANAEAQCSRKKQTLVETRDRLAHDRQASLAEKKSTEDELEQFKKTLRHLEVSINSSESRLEALENELKTPMRQLSAAEKTELSRTETELAEHRAELATVTRDRARLEAERNAESSSLESNWFKQRDELELEMHAFEAAPAQDQVTKDFEEAKETLQRLDEGIEYLATVVETEKKKQARLESETEKLRETEKKRASSRRDTSKRMDQLMSKRTSLEERHKETSAKNSSSGCRRSRRRQSSLATNGTVAQTTCSNSQEIVQIHIGQQESARSIRKFQRPA